MSISEWKKGKKFLCQKVSHSLDVDNEMQDHEKNWMQRQIKTSISQRIVFR